MPTLMGRADIDYLFHSIYFIFVNNTHVTKQPTTKTLYNSHNHGFFSPGCRSGLFSHTLNIKEELGNSVSELASLFDKPTSTVMK